MSRAGERSALVGRRLVSRCGAKPPPAPEKPNRPPYRVVSDPPHSRGVTDPLIPMILPCAVNTAVALCSEKDHASTDFMRSDYHV